MKKKGKKKRMATGKAALLLWAQRCTEGYEGVRVTDFSQSWADGLAFCALVAHHSPQSLDFARARALLREKGPLEVHRLAFTTAEALGCPALLDAEDMVALSRPEPFSVMTYLSQMHRTFASRGPAPAPAPAQAQAQAPPRPAKPQESSGFITEHKAEDQKKQPKQEEETPKLCAKCGNAVDGEAVGACGRLFHPACFCCFGCGKRLQREYLTVAGGAYCDKCGRKAFLANTAREFRQKKGLPEPAEPPPLPPKAAAAPVVSAAPAVAHIPLPSKPVPPRPPKPQAAPPAAEAPDPFADPFASEDVPAAVPAAAAPAAATTDSDPFALATKDEAQPPPRPPKPAETHKPTTEDLLFGPAGGATQQPDTQPPESDAGQTFGVDLTATLLAPQTAAAPAPATDDDSDLFGLPPAHKVDAMLEEAKARRSMRKTQRLPLPVTAENPDVFEYNAVTRYSIKPGEAPVLLPDLSTSDGQGNKDDDEDNPFAMPPAADDDGGDDSNPFAVGESGDSGGNAPASGDAFDDPFADPFAVDTTTTTKTTTTKMDEGDFDPFGALAIKEVPRTGTVRLLQAHAKPIVEGVLEKQNDSALLTRFVARYCLLEGRQLVYYPEGSRDASMAPSGTVDLLFADGVEPFAPRALSFAIRSADRQVVFGARSERDYGLWMSAIATVVASLKITHVPAPAAALRHQVQLDEERCGWLECFCARGGLLLLPRQWRRVWVVLRGGVVTCAGDRGGRVCAKLALYKAVLSEYQPDRVPNAFELATFVNDKHHSLILRADSTEAMHEWLNAVLRQKLAIEDTIDNLTL